jgi:hypothetical protein
MKRFFAIGLIIALAAGCGGSDTPASGGGTDTPNSVEESAVATETMRMENFEMRMYEEMTAATSGQKPTFKINAARGDSVVGAGWQLTKPEAIIYSEDGDDVTLSAATGTYDDASEMAELDGGVTAKISEMRMSLDTIQWDNKKRVAHSDVPVTLDGDRAILTAESIRIEPKDGTIELEDVAGTIQIGAFE